jgi:hypothetical protein
LQPAFREREREREREKKKRERLQAEALPQASSRSLKLAFSPDAPLS